MWGTYKHSQTMARLVFDNITMQQAQILADWYEGQGEQDAYTWFDVQGQGIRAPHANVHNKNWLKVDTVNEEVIMDCSPH